MISIIYNYYNKQKQVAELINYYSGFDCEFIFIDDGSTTPVVYEPRDNVIHARITDDIPWNMAGARNLGATLAGNDYLLFLDIDHYIDKKNFNKLTEYTGSVYYKFKRKYCGPDFAGDNIPEKYGKPMKKLISPNMIYIRKNLFWRTGGYDEDFSGKLGSMDLFHNALCEANGIQSVLHKAHIWAYDSPTEGLERPQASDRKLFNLKLNLLKNNKYRHPKNLNFKYYVY